jgi:hypothetical protein
LREQHALRLNSADVGVETNVVLISELVEDESAILTRLGKVNIMPGATLTVLSRLPDESELDVKVVPREDNSDGAQVVRLTNDLAAKIWVRKA